VTKVTQSTGEEERRRRTRRRREREEEEEKDEDASVKFAWAVGAFLEAGRAYRTANWYGVPYPDRTRYRTPYVPKVK
jgi:hypothetical protein